MNTTTRNDKRSRWARARQGTGHGAAIALRQTKARPPRLVALSLAEEMASAVAADREDRDDLVWAAITVGQWLADEGRPGRWDTVDPAAVLRGLPDTDERARGRFLLALTGLLGHAGLSGQIPLGSARDAVAAIARVAGDAIVRRFARDTARLLHRSLT